MFGGAGVSSPSPPVRAICGGTPAREGGDNIVFFADPEPPEACAGSLGEGCDEGRVPSLPFLFHKRRNPTLRDRRPTFWRGRAVGGARAPPVKAAKRVGVLPLSELSQDGGVLTPCKTAFDDS
ncbi:uncharacterized protein SCHCODRAFT_01342442 [Schizophyllum commune H4-8]|uniref:uncharacterized protein n=1 Tax=Schizophyllum commune (strain H4-8 / FGSC 9210) TaxID=578458 RepID=UPI00215DEE88|nr:uncharacterized protein SCHCODRAFT_01342442 [Schizophyllum commune H4-8]KAI5885642.1 hypothetical protein SCHCODRAFT_01342442 [Schizophyllum commune H4-8]